MWSHIDAFLNLLASTLSYDRSALSFVATRYNSGSDGPTVRPYPMSHKPESQAVAGPNVALPSVEYDSAKYRHVEYQVVHTIQKGAVSIPRTILSWRLWPFPGNCGLCIAQWVQMLDDKPWPADLKIAALNLRARIARANSYRTLLITTAPSYSGFEPLSEYKKIATLKGRSPSGLHALDLDSYLS